MTTSTPTLIFKDIPAGERGKAGFLQEKQIVKNGLAILR
jgi:hypothetical protein